ncbi:MAG: fucose isomerase [Deltaproteobacteria bacterium]|nr:fucose isomerase [Deltaproteobacteria bacterium]
MRKVAIFWPGDYRPRPNAWALPQVREATRQIAGALRRLGRRPYVVRGFLTRPDEAITRLGPIDDPMIGLFAHWTYGPHTCDGVAGKTSPLLLASNFSGKWPGLVALLNTAACLEAIDRSASRIWTEAKDWSKDRVFMARLDEWCSTGRIRYPEHELHASAAVPARALRLAGDVVSGVRARRPLALMLGDTSMGMINGYLGPRLLSKIGFAEHKVDQAWLLDRMKSVGDDRVEDALRFLLAKGLRFHWREAGAEDFTRDSTLTQLRMYFAVADLVAEFRADCLGWQYQLGLVPLLPPSDLCEGLFNTTCRPESSGEPMITATEADQGNLVPMELLKRLLRAKGLHPAVMFHDVRWGARHRGRWLWVLLNSGSSSAYAFNHDPRTLRGAHSYRQPAGYFPIAGGTLSGESLPGPITWARAYLAGGQLWMDVGRGEVVRLPPTVREAWWRGTTRQWPFMAADLGCSMETIMAHFMSNHVAVAYGDVFAEMVAASRALGFRVRVLGTLPT